MPLADLRDELMGLLLGGHLGLASNASQFLTAVDGVPHFNQIRGLLLHPNGAAEIAQEIRELLALDRDRRFAHPADLAIGFLLGSLLKCGHWIPLPLESRLAVEPGLWWAPIVIRHVRTGVQGVARATSEVTTDLADTSAWLEGITADAKNPSVESESAPAFGGTPEQSLQDLLSKMSGSAGVETPIVWN